MEDIQKLNIFFSPSTLVSDLLLPVLLSGLHLNIMAPGKPCLPAPPTIMRLVVIASHFLATSDKSIDLTAAFHCALLA
jgi:hypothetical protein